MDDLAALTAWRQARHQQPELSGAEHATAEAVRAALAPLAPDALETGLGGHGVLALFRGARPGPRVLLRCELDGLPIQETGAPAYKSTVPGQGHLCGHDGHMAILLGVAARLSAQRAADRDILLLFQPAEETGAGAKAVIEDPRFAAYRPDAALALHNMPGLPLAQVQIRPGSFACASQGLRITLTGRTAHASQPETGCSPAAALAELLTQIPDLAQPGTPLPRRMVTITHAQLGAPSFGVAPGEASLWVTLRSPFDAEMDALRDAAQALATRIAAAHGLRCTLDDHDVFVASGNDPELAQHLTPALRRAGLEVVPQPAPMRWSEDFGRFGALCPSVMMLLGAGEHSPALHNPDYDFPDALIGPGIDALWHGALAVRTG